MIFYYKSCNAVSYPNVYLYNMYAEIRFLLYRGVFVCVCVWVCMKSHLILYVVVLVRNEKLLLKGHDDAKREMRSVPYVRSCTCCMFYDHLNCMTRWKENHYTSYLGFMNLVWRDIPTLLSWGCFNHSTKIFCEKKEYFHQGRQCDFE